MWNSIYQHWLYVNAKTWEKYYWDYCATVLVKALHTNNRNFALALLIELSLFESNSHYLAYELWEKALQENIKYPDMLISILNAMSNTAVLEISQLAQEYADLKSVPDSVKETAIKSSRRIEEHYNELSRWINN